jgi:hypothetical protein
VANCLLEPGPGSPLFDADMTKQTIQGMITAGELLIERHYMTPYHLLNGPLESPPQSSRTTLVQVPVPSIEHPFGQPSSPHATQSAADDFKEQQDDQQQSMDAPATDSSQDVVRENVGQ